MVAVKEKPKPWQLELNNKESLVCLDLSMRLKSNNEINLTEREMYEHCGYKTSKYFKRHLQGLIDKGIIFKIKKEEGYSYYFNPIYVQYDELGPKYYQRPFIDANSMLKAINKLVGEK